MLTEKFIEKNFSKGKRTLVSSRPVMKKTYFSISLTISLTKQSRKCIYFSAEWKEQQLVNKLQIDIEEYNVIVNNIIVDDMGGT